MKKPPLVEKLKDKIAEGGASVFPAHAENDDVNSTVSASAPIHNDFN